ncbi:MAG: hypothetical protein R6U11_02550 [Bacteroidales bacterium]
MSFPKTTLQKYYNCLKITIVITLFLIKEQLFLSTITKIMGCKKLAYWSEAEIPTLRDPEKTAVIWSIYKSGEYSFKDNIVLHQ